jgi:glycosyltransferase involved in cell wall biosynthesis
MIIIYDVTRLINRASLKFFTGIDKVDYEYAKFLFEKNASFVYGYNGYFFIIDKLFIKCLFRYIESKSKGLRSSFVLFPVLSFFYILSFKLIGHLFFYIRRSKNIFVDSLLRIKNSELICYINTSHSNLEYLGVWRQQFRDKVKILSYLHDILPLSHKEYFLEASINKSRVRIENAIQFSDKILTSSYYNLNAIESYFHKVNAEINVINLGNRHEAFNITNTNLPSLNKPYFLMVGTIEPRKGHLLILDVWRKLLAELDDPPKLYIFGRKGWGMEKFKEKLSLLTSHEKGFIFFNSKISDNEIIQYTKSAIALLSPSFAEGWGLTVSESLSLGTPVIASNLDVYKEQAEEYIIFVKDNTSSSWLEKIKEVIINQHLIKFHNNLKKFKPNEWDYHFKMLEKEIIKFNTKMHGI